MNRLTMMMLGGVVVLGMCSAGLATTPMEAAQAGCDYLVGAQLANGGFPWEDGGSAAENITGATAIGLVRYYNVAGGTTYLDAAKKAGDYLKDVATYPPPDDDKTWFATFDPYFCWQVSLASGDSTWSDLAEQEFFDELSAGTYGPSNRDTANWIGAVQTGRSGAYVNMRSWEFSTLAVTAGALGSGAQQSAFGQAILDGLNTLDGTDPDSVYWDLLGITGAVRGLAMDGITSFTAVNSPNHASINGLDTLQELADYLAGQQNSDGSWYWATNITSPGEGDKDSQITAYAVLGLEAAAEELGISDYDDEIALARSWLVTMQKTDGGFYSFPGDTGPTNNEVTGEVVAALVPEPASLSLLVLGGLALVRRRRK